MSYFDRNKKSILISKTIFGFGNPWRNERGHFTNEAGDADGQPYSHRATGVLRQRHVSSLQQELARKVNWPVSADGTVLRLAFEENLPKSWERLKSVVRASYVKQQQDKFGSNQWGYDKFKEAKSEEASRYHLVHRNQNF